MDLPIHIIEKYLRGEANEQETRQVNNWFYSFDAEENAADEELLALRKQIGKRIYDRLDKSIDLSIKQREKATYQGAETCCGSRCFIGYWHVFPGPKKWHLLSQTTACR